MNECRDPQPNIGQSSGNPTEEGEGLEKAEELRTPEDRSPLNRIKQGSQTLNDQLGSLDGFSLGTLHMCYDCLAWGFCVVLLTVGMGMSLTCSEVRFGIIIKAGSTVLETELLAVPAFHVETHLGCV